MGLTSQEKGPWDAAVSEADFVIIYSMRGPETYAGFVVSNEDGLLRVIVHGMNGDNPLTCLGKDMVFPWTSVHHLVHTGKRPDGCRCSDGLEAPR